MKFLIIGNILNIILSMLDENINSLYNNKTFKINVHMKLLIQVNE